MASSLYSVFVYLLTLLLMLFFNAVSISNTRTRLNAKPKINIPLLSILVFAIVFGIRYNVGIDHLRYVEQYNSIRHFDNIVDKEIGYVTLQKFFACFDFHYAFFFTFIAFLQLFLICYSVKDHYEVIGWLFITFMLSTTYLNFMNVIRQYTAFCFLCIALYNISKRKFLICYINILFAILFHKSAILLLPLPLLYLNKESYFNNVKVQFIIFVVFVLVAMFLKPAVIIFTYLIDILALLGYDDYKYMVLGGDLSFLESQRQAGLGFILLVVLNSIIIIYSNKVKKFFNSRYLNVVYDFYFVGLLYNYLVSGSLILQRINCYFYTFSFLVSAFLLLYLFKNKSRRHIITALFILVIYFLVFASVVVLRGYESCAIYNTCF